jgi:hypothetical protein
VGVYCAHLARRELPLDSELRRPYRSCVVCVSHMKSTAVAGLLIATMLSGSSRGNGPVDSASGGANPAPHGNSSAYLGKEADLIAGIVLRPAAAIVLLSEPCGAQPGYARARLFSYEPLRSAPAAEHDGCYGKRALRAGTQAMIVVYESDGTSIGKPVLKVPGAEVFAPRHFFLPLDGDADNLQSRIVAVAESSTRHASGTDYFSLGLTRQPCPFEQAWRLARHLAEGRSDRYTRCWQERGSSIAVRAVEHSKHAPPRLSADERQVDKAAFFAAATLATTPVKYDWSSR